MTDSLLSCSTSSLPSSVALDRVDEPVSVPLREVLALFDEALQDVRFPDVDGGALHAGAQAVATAHAELRQLEAAVESARRRLDEAQEVLLHKAQRAVAYARVFADGDEGLTARLDAITLPRGRGLRPVTAAPEPTRRRRRSSATVEPLFPTSGSEVDIDGGGEPQLSTGS
jgi:hypothetical protein